MATERNAGGQEGAGLSGMGEPGLGAPRDNAGLDAGTTRSQALGDRELGTGEVHTDISVGRTEGYSAIAAAGTGSSTGGGQQQGGQGLQDRAMNRAREMGDQVKDRAQGVVNDVQNRVSGMTGQAREQVDRAMDRAEGMLEERGVLDQIRNHPLPALGIAFGIGFLLAGGGDDEEEHERTRSRRGRQSGGRQGGGALGGVMDQLKGALVGSLSAALATEAKGLLEMAQGKGNQGGLFGSLMENLQGGGGSRQGGSGQQGGTRSGTATQHRPPSHQESL